MGQYVAVLRNNANYRALWLGNVISLLGDWFNLIASAALVARLTNTGVAISLLFLARFLPLFLFSPIAGVLADRANRRTLLILSDVLRAVVVAGFLLVRQPHMVWLLYGLTVAQFALSALFTPARAAVLASVVPASDLVTANALDSLTWSTMLALGALLGGIVASLFGGDVAFLLDAGTFLISAWFISHIPSHIGDRSHLPRSGDWLTFLQGLRYLRGAPTILILSLVKGGGSLIWGAINVLEITYAKRLFPLGRDGTATLGLIYAAAGVGTGLGPLLIRRWFGDDQVRMRWAITGSFAWLAGGILLLSQVQNIPGLILATLVRTVGTGTIWVFSAAILQTTVPDEYRGRVFAFEFAFLTLTQSLSTFWAGFAQDQLHLGIRQITALMGWGGLIVGLGWLVFHLRMLKWRAQPGMQSSD